MVDYKASDKKKQFVYILCRSVENGRSPFDRLNVMASKAGGDAFLLECIIRCPGACLKETVN